MQILVILTAYSILFILWFTIICVILYCVYLHVKYQIAKTKDFRDLADRSRRCWWRIIANNFLLLTSFTNINVIQFECSKLGRTLISKKKLNKRSAKFPTSKLNDIKINDIDLGDSCRLLKLLATIFHQQSPSLTY